MFAAVDDADAASFQVVDAVAKTVRAGGSVTVHEVRVVNRDEL